MAAAIARFLLPMIASDLFSGDGKKPSKKAKAKPVKRKQKSNKKTLKRKNNRKK